MGVTNFPNGVSSRGVPLFGDLGITAGNIYFVHAGTGSNGNTGLDIDRPLATIDAAINLTTATSATSPGEDYIIVLPAHVETYTAANGFDLDVAGVTILGLGRGPLRPTLTLNTPTSTDTAVGANGTAIANLLYIAGVNSLVACLNIDATTGLLLEALEFRDVVSSIGIVDTIDLADEVEIHIMNCKFEELDDGVGQSCILGTTPDRLVISGCRFDKDAQTGTIELGAATQIQIVNNFIESIAPEDLAIVLAATATGWINNNYIRLNDNSTNITECITIDNNCQLGENYVVNLDGETQIVHNQTASTDA